MLCRKCKMEIPDGSKYCNLCGANQNPEKRKALRRPNGTGTVYKQHGRRKRPWIAVKNGVVIGFYETKTAGIEALEAFSKVKIPELYNITFLQVYKAWSDEHFSKVSAESVRSYEIARKAFAPIQNQKFRELRTSDFQHIIDENADHPVMVKKYKNLLNLLYKWAIRESICTVNYASFVSVPKQKKKDPITFTDDEIRRINEAAAINETAKIVSMLLATGMRIGELFKARTEDYHGMYLIGGEKTKAGIGRIIPIREEGRAHFEYFATKSKKSGKALLLGSYKGNHDQDNFRKNEYNNLLRSLNIDIEKTPHSTRRTYATRAVKENVDPAMLKAILGHEKYSTTIEYYTKFDAETLVKEIDKTSSTTST